MAPCRTPLLGGVLLLAATLLGLQAQSNASSTSSSTTVMAALLSDPHLDPFRDPGKAKRLATASVSQWAAILASPASPDADAQFAVLQKSCSERLPDATTQLELSAFDDAAATHPAVVLVAGDMLVHSFGCRYHALLDPAGTDVSGMAEFAAKTVEFQLGQLRLHFPNTPVHLALGNNDSDCEDYTLDDDSRFLDRLADAVGAGWQGLPAAQRSVAKQTFKHLGSYSLPLTAQVPDTRLVVLDDLYLSSDYRGTCGKGPKRASAAALLTWLAQELAAAKRAHQSVWLLAHIPPTVNIYRTYLHPHDICHGEAAPAFFRDDAFLRILSEYADTVRVFISGHTHVDEIHLLQAEGAGGAAVPLKVIPSVSPVSNNAPAYLLAEIDPATGTLVDYRKRVASASTGPDIRWSTAYRFRDRYQEPAFTARAVGNLFDRWQRDPAASATQIDAYATSVASGLRLLAFRTTWPQQLCAMQHSSAAAFAACACAAKGGMLPPVQNAK